MQLNMSVMFELKGDKNNTIPVYNIFPLRQLPWNRNKYLCFYVFPPEFGGVGDFHTHQKRRVLC